MKNMAEKVNPIIIKDKPNNREFTLEFDRDAIRFAENRGFKLEDVDDYSMTKVPEFFWYAFRMHHKSFSLNQAEELLRQPGAYIADVAYRSGFSDPKYFSKCFKKLTGMTPTEFQKS